jgi:PiT family inorganic phosphate transporter
MDFGYKWIDFLAFNNGANDFANAFAPAVGSKALMIKHALLIAAMLNLLGAILLGSNVSDTLIDGIVNFKCFHSVHDYIVRMLACKLAAGSLIFVSPHTELPVSSTVQSSVGLWGS